MKKQHVQLTENDRTYLKELLSKGELAVKTYKRALALLELDRGKTYTADAKTIQTSPITVSRWSRKYADVGLNILIDQPRSGRPPEIDGAQRAKVTALACSDPPKDMHVGHCECWPIEPSNWAMSSISRIPRSERYSKKRSKTASQAKLVFWRTDQPVSSLHGTAVVALQPAV